MTSTIEVSNPQTRRVNSYRIKNKKKWTGAEWKKAREGFIKSHGGKCEWCGRTTRLQVHHPMRNVYGKTVYEDFVLSQCILLCQACHTATENGFELCLSGGKNGLHKDGEYHYRYHDADMCSFCFKELHPEVEEKKKADKIKAEQSRRKHPCGNNLGRQKCKVNPVCDRSARKAEGCNQFIEKVKA